MREERYDGRMMRVTLKGEKSGRALGPQRSRTDCILPPVGCWSVARESTCSAEFSVTTSRSICSIHLLDKVRDTRYGVRQRGTCTIVYFGPTAAFVLDGFYLRFVYELICVERVEVDWIDMEIHSRGQEAGQKWRIFLGG